jgi:hypothetical protein
MSNAFSKKMMLGAGVLFGNIVMSLPCEYEFEVVPQKPAIS